MHLFYTKSRIDEWEHRRNVLYVKKFFKVISFTNSEEKFKRMSVYVVKSGNLSNIYLNEVLYIHWLKKIGKSKFKPVKSNATYGYTNIYFNS